LWACAGGTDTGNPNDGGPTENGNGELCDQSERALDLDETTSLGVSANDLLSWVSGEHREALAWQDSAGSFGPEHGRSEITLEIGPLGARFIDRRAKERTDNGEEGGPTIALAEIGTYGDPCADSIALDVRLHLSTSGGALDETLDATLEAKAPDFVTGQLGLPLDTLNGSFEAEVPVPPGFVVHGTPRLVLSLGVSEYGSTGELGLSSEFRSTDGQAAAQGGVGVLARFPADNFCGTSSISIAADQTLRGLSMASVLERLNTASPAALDGSSATLQLEFASQTARVCVALDAPLDQPAALEFPGTVRLRSSDQRIDGTFPVQLSGEATSGALHSSRAEASEYLLDPARATAAARGYAIRAPLDFSEYDGGAFQFSTEVTDTEAVGALQAFGLDQADCVTNPPPPDPDGNGSPGCSGTERIPIWGASWSK
jgi:hypothetical protein